MYVYLFLLPLSIFSKTDQNANTINFPSKDGITITAELYMMHDKTAPFIVLFHQARSSRGEYEEIAPRLNMMGFNCMAVDLRSGGSQNGVRNETTIVAKEAMKPTTYVDAYKDMESAIDYAKNYYVQGKIIIWGSSYSSALVLKYAGDYPANVDAVLSFSPGEYFSSLGKPKDWITQSAAKITKPVFITSARSEKSSWSGIFAAIPSDQKEFYLPTTAGNHGSKALWNRFGDSVFYWEAVEKYLTKFK